MAREFSLAAILVLVALVLAPAAQAQCPTTPSWNENIQAQLTEDLADTTRQAATLSLTLDLARRECLVVATPALVDELVAIYGRDGMRNQHQMLAALILGELDATRGLAELRTLVAAEESPTVRKVTNAVLEANPLVAMN